MRGRAIFRAALLGGNICQWIAICVLRLILNASCEVNK